MVIDLSRQLIARWPDSVPTHVPLLQRAGIEVVITPGPPGDAFVKAASDAGIAIAPESALSGAITSGTWPGIRRPGRNRNWDNDLFASASAEPWIDSNSYLVPLERARHQGSSAAPVIAYQASPEAGLPADRSVPFETLEVALIEARLQGGNYVLSLDPRYRAALDAGEPQALAAWTSLGRTASWLRDNSNLLGRAAPPALTALVEPGNATAEIANLLYRRGASPRLVSAAAPPGPDARSIMVLVAASLSTVPDMVWRHAEAGSTVVIDNTALIRPDWRRIKQEPDRDFFTVGAGRVVAYRRRITDPSEFALDMIDLIGHQRRTSRLWNAQSSVPFATAGAAPGEAMLHIINYGSPVKDEVQARLNGRYTQATLLRPEAPPVALKTGQRGFATEVFLPGLSRVASVRFRA